MRLVSVDNELCRVILNAGSLDTMLLKGYNIKLLYNCMVSARGTACVYSAIFVDDII